MEAVGVSPAILRVPIVVISLVLPLWTSTSLASSLDSDIGHFWQISDLHLDLDYSTDGDPANNCHKDKSSKNLSKLGEFGYPSCGSPWLLVQGAVDAMKTIKADPDFVLWTGDTSPKLPQGQLNQKKILDLIEKVTVLLNSTFPGIYLFPVLGNHDVYPVHQMPPDNKHAFYENMLKNGQWGSILSADEQATFLKGGYYSRMINPGVTIIVLNTNLYYYMNKLTKDVSDPAGQFEWFTDILKQQKSVSHSVIVVGHVPPGSSEISKSLNWFYPNFNTEYVKVVSDYSSTIHTQIFGHEHEDTYRLFTNDKGDNTFGSAYIQSSICPVIGRNKSVNPSIRLYEYNRDTGQVTDIFQYYLDFRDANQKKKANWKLEYQAKKEYSIPDLSSKTLKNLTDSFKSDKSKNFDNYFSNSDVRFSADSCDAECKKLQLCAIQFVDYNRYNACIYDAVEFDPELVETSLETTTPEADENYTEYVSNATTHHHHEHHHPMPIYIFYLLATLCALAIAAFMASAIICLRRKREPRYVRVVSLADMSAGYQT